MSVVRKCDRCEELIYESKNNDIGRCSITPIYYRVMMAKSSDSQKDQFIVGDVCSKCVKEFAEFFHLDPDFFA